MSHDNDRATYIGGGVSRSSSAVLYTIRNIRWKLGCGNFSVDVSPILRYCIFLLDVYSTKLAPCEMRKCTENFEVGLFN